MGWRQRGNLSGGQIWEHQLGRNLQTQAGWRGSGGAGGGRRKRRNVVEEVCEGGERGTPHGQDGWQEGLVSHRAGGGSDCGVNGW